MTKIVRVPLICATVNNNGEEVDYKKVNEILWDLQRQTRDIRNKSLQYAWEWLGFSNDYKEQYEEYPKEKDFLNYTLSGYVYDKLKSSGKYTLYTSNMSASSRDALAKFNGMKKEILRGDVSIPSYKADMPLDICKQGIILTYEDGHFYLTLKLLNRAGGAKYDVPLGLKFKASVKDKSQIAILERCYDKVYDIAGSKLLYDKKKKMWCLNLCYCFEATMAENLDKEKILGVNLGIVYPLFASVKGDRKRFSIEGGEIEAFRKRVEARRISVLKATKHCGKGRIGHGTKTRIKPAFDVAKTIANFRDSVNHKYSTALVNYAKNNNCGIIQMENLKGISSSDPDNTPFLKKWSYYDLQSKIEQKAKACGIKVVYIDPKYTTLRCSKCGCIHTDNRPTRERFRCTNCGFEECSDYNASQNIATQDIEEIIKEAVKNKE